MRVPSSSSFLLLLVGKQSQLLLKPSEVELGLQVRVEFDNRVIESQRKLKRVKESPVESNRVK